MPLRLTAALDPHLLSAIAHSYHYREDFKNMPFGAVWSHYATGIKIIGGYFDDCIVVLDNPTDVIITASSWLLGKYTGTYNMVLGAFFHAFCPALCHRTHAVEHAGTLHSARASCVLCAGWCCVLVGACTPMLRPTHVF